MILKLLVVFILWYVTMGVIVGFAFFINYEKEIRRRILKEGFEPEEITGVLIKIATFIFILFMWLSIVIEYIKIHIKNHFSKD